MWTSAGKSSCGSNNTAAAAATTTVVDLLVLKSYSVFFRFVYLFSSYAVA